MIVAMHVAAHSEDAGRAGGGWERRYAPPEVELSPWTGAELDALFRGEAEAEDCERLLVWASRARGAIDVAIGEGLDALRRGDRLARLGYHLTDYAREVLDVGERTALELARLGRELRTRPLLRAALRSGRVRLRAAQTVLAVATGEAEAAWVERAARLTVRGLEQEVRRDGADPGEPDEPWARLGVHLEPEEREVVEMALELAEEVRSGARPRSPAHRIDGLEALSQEFLAEHPTDPDDDERRPLDGAFRPLGEGEARRRAVLETELERWVALPGIGECPVPDVEFVEAASAEEIDRQLRVLARLRRRWDELVGSCAHAILRTGIHLRLGFASFRHYVEERLQLPARAVEQRAALERRLGASPGLREARRQGLPYEKLRVLSVLPEQDVGAWTPRAHALTCIDLKRRVEGERERQMRAVRRLAVPLPRRVAVLLTAAIEAVRARVGRALTAGKSLALIAWHFLETWQGVAREPRTRSQKVRDRDGGLCQVPGCSRRATDAHHVEFRSHGGGDEPENQVSVCEFHHLRCIHGGFLRVVGRAPDALTWILGGQRWTGRS